MSSSLSAHVTNTKVSPLTSVTQPASRSRTSDAKPSANALSAIDVFCGCGGLTVGLRNAGFRVVFALDIDSRSVETYRANHSDVPVGHMDIRDFDPGQLLSDLNLSPGELDLVAGCPPCQGFSRLRTLNGSLHVADPRNDLLSEFERVVQALLPRAVMMENVPGLASNQHFTDFCQSLDALGYVGTHRILDAADFGVPQRRRRLIYLAGYAMRVPFATSRGHSPTVRDAIAHLPPAGHSGDRIHDIPERRSPNVIRLIATIPKNGGSRADLPDHMQLPCHRRSDGFSDIYGRMAWDHVAPTITSGSFNPSKGRFLHPQEDRAITIREAALLQGFPKDYTFFPTHGKENLAAMIGNALPPPFVAAHGANIRDTLHRSPR